MPKVIERKVPCNGCTACCHNEAIYLHPECGDNAALYKTVVFKGRRMLDHKPNGDCIYLGETGCTIYDYRPVICRELDCREIVARTSRPQLRRLEKKGLISSEVLKQGRYLLGRHDKDTVVTRLIKNLEP